MNDSSRRSFLSVSTAALASSTVAPAVLRARNLNDRMRVAIVGMGGRANAHAQSLIELEQDSGCGVELAGI